jgi:hypothetical protein
MNKGKQPLNAAVAGMAGRHLGVRWSVQVSAADPMAAVTATSARMEGHGGFFDRKIHGRGCVGGGADRTRLFGPDHA